MSNQRVTKSDIEDNLSGQSSCTACGGLLVDDICECQVSGSESLAVVEAVQVRPGRWVKESEYLERIKRPADDMMIVPDVTGPAECFECAEEFSDISGLARHIFDDNACVVDFRPRGYKTAGYVNINNEGTGALSRRVAVVDNYSAATTFLRWGYSVRVRNKVSGCFVRRSVWELFRNSKLVKYSYEVYA